MSSEEKTFNINFKVSCKNLRCDKQAEHCYNCLRNFVGQNIIRFSNFRCSQVTTSNNSKQFGVSFLLICIKPDCTVKVPRNVTCCTANPEKCEICLRSIVNNSIIAMEGFHAKELTIV